MEPFIEEKYGSIGSGVSRTGVRLRLLSVVRNLSYRLEMALRTLASTTNPDGSVQLSRPAVLNLLELHEEAGVAVSDLARLRNQLLELVNDPTVRTT